MQFGVDSFDVR